MTKELLQQADEALTQNFITYSPKGERDVLKLLTLIKALADEVRGKEWQDISTARKNEAILVRDFNGDHFEAYQRDGGTWCAQDPRGGGAYYLAINPAHWQPLPQPPKEK